jgi:hypothetical protein
VYQKGYFDTKIWEQISTTIWMVNAVQVCG